MTLAASRFSHIYVKKLFNKSIKILIKFLFRVKINFFASFTQFRRNLHDFLSKIVRQTIKSDKNISHSCTL